MDRPAPPPSRPILLVGLPGAGKSTIAPLLAAALGWPSCDSDALVEAARGRSIAEIVREGEARFRAEERQILAGLLRGAPAVIAAGGGAWLDSETRSLALMRSTAIWLDAELEVLVLRLQGVRDRPLLVGDLRAKLALLKATRDPLYALASLRVDAAPAPGQVLGAILAALAEPVR